MAVMLRFVPSGRLMNRQTTAKRHHNCCCAYMKNPPSFDLGSESAGQPGLAGPLRSVRLESAVPGPEGQLGYLLFAPRTADLAREFRDAVSEVGCCWEDRFCAWWVDSQSIVTVVAVLERHRMTPHQWLARRGEVAHGEPNERLRKGL